ncbi:MAG: thiamine phosphate synthase [Acetobacteraceae bacterium]
MRPLPRLLAYADDRIAVLDDLGVRAAALAAIGPAMALVARRPAGSADQLAALASRFAALAEPPMAGVLVTGRIDIALATRANGVILRQQDLAVEDVRSLCTAQRGALIFRSVHSFAEAVRAASEGVDALVVGSIWPTATHPDGAVAGTTLLARVVSLGVPTFAIGGVTAARAREAAAAGAWGAAAVSALWDAPDPHLSAMELLQPWN